jgi:DNA-binding GntR family transcriptional regulator
MDREPGVAPFRLIADELRQEIEDGTYPVGGLFPSQADLMKRFGVAQMTIRNAVDLLELWGLVTRQQGRGTFVTATEVKQA